jgi:hypothetical protein
MDTPMQNPELFIKKLLADDKNIIIYRKLLRPICGNSVTATILFNQLLYWFDRYPEGFYKSIDKPDDPNSFCSELGFSADEFKTAFAKIGVRYKSKGEYDQAEKNGSLFKNSTGEDLMFCSFTDRIRFRTWFFKNDVQINENIRKLAMSMSVNRQSRFTYTDDPGFDNNVLHRLHTEITTETTSSLSDSLKEKDMDFSKNQKENIASKKEENIGLNKEPLSKPTSSVIPPENRTSAPEKSKPVKKQKKSQEDVDKVKKWFEETFWKNYPHRNGIPKTKGETFTHIIEHMTMDELRKVDRGLKNFLKDKSVADGIGIPDPIRFVRPRRGETTALYESYQEAPVQPEKIDAATQQMLDAGVSREFIFGKRGK